LNFFGNDDQPFIFFFVSLYFQVCTKTSSSYQEFSLDSPLISSILSSQSSDFTLGRKVSPSDPIALQKGKYIQATLYFASTYKMMEIRLNSTQQLKYFFCRTGQSKPALASTLLSSNGLFYEYLITINASTTQATDRLIIIIVSDETTYITACTLTACIGNISLFEFDYIF